MLQYIDVNKIYPHPDNPRKDLGDLTELAESIKENGILQNLTVVPRIMGGETPEGHWQDGYTVIIGHRRLAAAKLAGLKTVPCIVVNMSESEQIATMLMENIQRSDLTVYEQAQGFQQLLNFDYSVADIAEKTGFSETTVRKRVKLLELDQEKFKESVARGGTLQDYAELNKIEDINLRNKVLETVGTSEFKWRLKSALEEQEMPKRKQEFLEFVKDWAKHVKTAPNNSSYEHHFFRYKLDDYKKPKDAGKVEYYYVDNGNGAMLYKKTADAKPKPKSNAEKSFKEREAQIKELTKRAYQLRRDFVLNFNAGKKHIDAIMTLAMVRLIRYGGIDTEILMNLLGIEIPANESKDYTEKYENRRNLVMQKFKEEPIRVMLITAWSSLDSIGEDYYDAHSYNFIIDHAVNPTLDAIYDVLISLGYEMSEEEMQLRNGTHELFTPKPNKDCGE